jgi:uncharacterized protein YbaP (TraB family)
MRNLIALLLCIALLPAYAQHVQTGGGQRSLLWKISGNGLPQPSYLYGTVHLLCKGQSCFTPAVDAAFKSTRQLFLEVNMDNPELLANMQQLLMMPEGYSFKNLYQPDDYKKLDQFFKDSVGYSLSLFDKMKPMAILGLLMQQFVPCKETVSCEQELVKMAKAQQKQLNGLERLEDQIAIFDSIPDKDEAAGILKMVTGLTHEREQFQKLVKAYQQQDIEALYQQIQQSPEIAPFKNILLDNRNASWIPVMRRHMQQTPTFFACGAGHLAGPEGVIQLLRNEGYKVEAVR